MPESRFFQDKLAALKTELKGQAQLLIVTKHRTPEEIQAYYDLGHRDFGENRVQELAEKAQLLKDRCPEMRWHMIGGLQSNKINQLFAVPGLVAIHSVHNEELLQKLLRAQNRLTSPLEVFLQVKTSDEEEKSGFESFEDLLKAARSFQGSKQLRLTGLMTMGKIRTDDFATDARACFKRLNAIKAQLEKTLGCKLVTSMGMSQDYRIALEEGSHWIRLGTTMFEKSAS